MNMGYGTKALYDLGSMDGEMGYAVGVVRGLSTLFGAWDGRCAAYLRILVVVKNDSIVI